MNIVVIREFELIRFPPAINLVNALLDLGHTVTLMAHGVDNLPKALLDRDGLITICFDKRGSRFHNLVHMFNDRRVIRDYLRSHKGEIDLVWTTTDISAREAGDELLNFKYVLQLSELVEYVPLIKSSTSRLHDDGVIELARQASRVVVPEYNRAHIQQAYWSLPETPKVLPNKPYPDTAVDSAELTSDLKNIFEAEHRKILLYQGVFTADRDLKNYAEAVNILGDDYVLGIMGKPLEAGVDRYHDLRGITDRVLDLGFVAAPNHLAVTPYGHIGLLPYKAANFSHYSVLNALYCAPNKIWEYSRFGLPMIGSDVPGLASAFKDGDMGFTVDGTPESIAAAVRSIDADYERYSANSREYYKSVDVKQIVSEIIDEAMR